MDVVGVGNVEKSSVLSITTPIQPPRFLRPRRIMGIAVKKKKGFLRKLTALVGIIVIVLQDGKYPWHKN